jgi:hypothetical protein
VLADKMSATLLPKTTAIAALPFALHLFTELLRRSFFLVRFSPR